MRGSLLQIAVAFCNATAAPDRMKDRSDAGAIMSTKKQPSSHQRGRSVPDSSALHAARAAVGDPKGRAAPHCDSTIAGALPMKARRRCRDGALKYNTY